MSSFSSPFECSFTNRHGEDWIFSFDPNTNTALVKGSDIDWESYPVIDGIAYGLVMNVEERAWLSGVWGETCSTVPALSLYLGKPTELVIGAGHCRMSNDYCPICLLQKQEFEVHHCIWKCDGGPDSASNLLAICKSCHAIVTRGSVEDRFPRNQAAFHHQIMHFGIRLFQDVVSPNNASRASSLIEQNPLATKMAELLANASPEEIADVDQRLRSESRITYQYLRDVALGKWPWGDFERRVLKPLTDAKEGGYAEGGAGD